MTTKVMLMRGGKVAPTTLEQLKEAGLEKGDELIISSLPANSTIARDGGDLVVHTPDESAVLPNVGAQLADESVVIRLGAQPLVATEQGNEKFELPAGVQLQGVAAPGQGGAFGLRPFMNAAGDESLQSDTVTGQVMGDVTTSGIKNAGLGDSGLMGDLRTDVRTTDETPEYLARLSEKPIDPYIDVPSNDEFGIGDVHGGGFGPSGLNGPASAAQAPSVPATPNFLLSPGDKDPTPGAPVIQNVTQPQLVGSGPAGALITAYAVDGHGNLVSLGTAPTDSNGQFTITPSAPMADGTYNVVFQAQQGPLASSLSAPTSVVIDTHATTPTLQLAPSSDSFGVGTSGTNSDDITNVKLPSLIGTAHPGDTVYVSDAQGHTVSAIADVNGQYTVQVSQAMTEGSNTFTSYAVDRAGNTSTSVSLGVTLDTVIAPLAAPTLDPGSDSGVSHTDGITNVTAPVFTGSGAEAGSLVTLYANGMSIGQANADATGHYTIQSTALGADGQYQVTAQQVDIAGNTSTLSTATTVTLDTLDAKPANLHLVDDTFGVGTAGTASDGLTKDSQITITGTAEAGDVVTLMDGTVSVGQATANANGGWTINTASLADGVHSLTATSTDAAGNTSAASAVLPVTIDTDAPKPTLALSSSSDTFGAGTTGTNHDNITSATQPTFNGTADPGAYVQLYDVTGGTTVSVGQATADATGSWTTTLASPLSGSDAGTSHSLVAVAIDPAGNTSSASAADVVVIDNAAAPLAAPTLDPGSDSGVSHTDGITNVTTPVFTGSGAEAGSLVTLYANGLSIGHGNADAGGHYTIQSNALGADGQYQVTAQQVDIAGNTSTLSAATTVTLDTLDPKPANLHLVDDTFGVGTAGTASDGLTKDSQVTITGTAESGDVVTLMDGTVSVGQATADANGGWTIHTASLADGVHSLTATSVDPAGNTSAASAPLPVTIDTTTSTPTLTLSPSSDTFGTGTTGTNHDNITSVTQPTFNGTAEAGAYVQLYDVTGGTTLSVGEAVAGNNGTWSTALSSPLSGSAAGTSHSLVAVAIDPAGNTSSTSAADVVVIDNSTPPPSTPVLIPADADVNATTTTHTRPDFTGTAEAGAAISLLDNGVVVGVGNADSTGHWTIQTNTLSPGGHTITAVAVDIAGNTNTSAAAPISIAQQVTTPPAPVLLTADDTAPIDSTNNDDITRVTTPHFTGTTGAGFNVTLFVDGVSVGHGVAGGNGNWTIQDATSLADGVHQVTVKVSDPMTGLTSAMGPALAVTIDTATPPTPVAQLASYSDSLGGGTTGTNSDGLTNITNPWLTGTAVAGTEELVKEGTTTIGVATTNSSGAWSLQVLGSLADGAHTFSVTSYDIANNKSAPANVVVTVDTVATAGTTPALLQVDDSFSPLNANGTNHDDITNVLGPRFTGVNQVAGGEVLLYDNGALIGSATSLGAVGSTWTVSSGNLFPGTHFIQSRYVDPAGNTGSLSAGLTVQIDTNDPAPTNLQITPGSDSGFSNTDRITNDTTPIFTGQAAYQDAVILTANNGTTVATLGVVTVGASGSWSLTPTSMPDATYTVSAVAVDVAGNTSAPAVPIQVVVDTHVAPPSLTLLSTNDTFGAGTTGTNSDSLTRVTAPLMVGVATPGAHVTVVQDGATIGTVVADSSTGSYTIQASPMLDGVHTFQAQQVDVAGNTSTFDAPVLVTIDTDCPTPTITSLTPATDSFGVGTSGTNSDARTNSHTLAMEGTGEDPGSAVDLYQLTVSGSITTSTSVAHTQAGAGGSFTFSTFAAPASDGTYSYVTREIDPAGNTSAISPVFQVVIDRTTVAPTFTLQNDTMYTGSPNWSTGTNSGGGGSANFGNTTDDLTMATQPILAGTVEEPGSLIVVYRNGASIGQATSNGSGAWQFTDPASQADGTYSYSAYQVDLAGNTSAMSSNLAVTIETQVANARFVQVQTPAGASSNYYAQPVGIPALANGLSAAEIYNVSGGHTGVPVYFQIDPTTASKSKPGDIVVVDFTFTYASGTGLTTATSETTYTLQAADLTVTAGNTPTLTTWVAPATFYANNNWQNTYLPINQMTVELQVRNPAGDVGFTNTPNVDVLTGTENAAHVNQDLWTEANNTSTNTWLGNGVQVYRQLGRPNAQLGSTVLVGDDLNGDGTRDLFLWAPGSGAANNNGMVYVVDGQENTAANGTGFVDLQNVGTAPGWGEAHGAGAATGGYAWTGMALALANYTFTSNMGGDGHSELVAANRIGGYSQGSPQIVAEVIYNEALGSGGWAQSLTGSTLTSGTTTQFYVPLHTDTAYHGGGAPTNTAVFGQLAPYYDINGAGRPDLFWTDGGTGSSGGGSPTTYGDLIVGYTPSSPVGLDNLTLPGTSMNLAANKGFYVYSTDALHPLGEGDGYYTPQDLWAQPIGCLTGDGLTDIAVGQADGSFNTRANNGRVAIIFGRNDGTGVDVNNLQPGQGFYITWNSATNAGDQFGYQIKSMDLTGSGYDDLVISCRSSAGANSGNPNTFDFVIDGKWLANYVHTHLNDPGGIPTLSVDALYNAMASNTPNAMGFIIGDPTNTNFSGNTGYPMNLGVPILRADLNGDGYQDTVYQSGSQYYVLWGSPDYQPGKYANYGTSWFQQPNHLELLNNSSGGPVQFSDINGDGLWDVVLGNAGDTTDGSNAGKVEVVYGANSQTGGTAAPGSPMPFASSYTNSWSASNNTVTGTSGSDQLVGGPGNATLVGNGGVDVLQGGGGNNTLVVNGDNIANFDTPGSRWDGGIVQQGHINTLQFDTHNTVNATLDLTIATNGSDLNAHIHNIERFDLNGNGNTLKFDIRSVLDTSSMGVFLDGGGNGETWSGSTWDASYTGSHGGRTTPLGPNVPMKQWVIDGNATNTLDFEAFTPIAQAGASAGLTGNWSLVGHVNHNDVHGAMQTYDIYEFSGSNVQVIVNHNIHLTHGGVPGSGL
ncbi:beta strand repeat-containing protein [Trinickia fusca]|uniref:Hemolysin n=1 Tax=Trinickia fusca TaxID=2419777 RepID=A0A494XB63_9BURK|nr:Ig-like domain-containing protein [Trinickia fusca]RKP46881.1 hemolysin [Trinickia fusca]